MSKNRPNWFADNIPKGSIHPWLRRKPEPYRDEEHQRPPQPVPTATYAEEHPQGGRPGGSKSL